MYLNDTPDSIPTKQCSKCKEWKSATSENFARDKGQKDGLERRCKTCIRAYYIANKESMKASAIANYTANRQRKLEHSRAYRLANPKKVAEWKRAWRIAHKETAKKRDRFYYEANKERHREQQRAWNIANKDRKAELDRAYRETNPEARRATENRRRARKHAAQGTHTAANIKAQHKAQKGKCYYCGNKVGKSYHVDHVIPLSRGGSDGPENIVISCAHCNLSKHDKLPHEWPEGNRLL